MSRRGHIVVDAFTGALLEGSPTYELIAASVMAPTAVPARLHNGMWLVAEPTHAQRQVRAERVS